MKREADEDDVLKQEADKQARIEVDSEDEDLDAPVSAASKRIATVKKGSECPYLDTVSRQVGALPFTDPWTGCPCHSVLAGVRMWQERGGTPPRAWGLTGRAHWLLMCCRTWTSTSKNVARCR